MRARDTGLVQDCVRSFGSKFGERTGTNPCSAGSEFGERTWSNPGSEFGFGAR